MLSSRAPGYTKTRRDARAVSRRDNRGYDAVPSQRKNPQPGAPVKGPLIDQSRQPYPPYTQYKHNYAGPLPSYHTNPSVTTLKIPRRETHTTYPTPPNSPECTTHLKVDQAGPEPAASLAFNDVASQPPQRVETICSVQTVSTIRLEDLDILRPPASPNSPLHRTSVYDEATYPSPTSSISPGRSPGADLVRILATESVTTLPSYASMAPSDSNLAVHEYSDVVADLDAARNAAADLWKRTVVCSECNGTAVCGGYQIPKFSIKDVDLKAADSTPCPSLDATLIRCCWSCGTYCRGCHKRPQCLSPKNCKRRRSVASYEIITSLEEEIIRSGGVSSFLNNARTWETLHKAFKALTFYYECGSKDNNQWNCDNLLRLSLVPRVIQSVLQYGRLSDWLGSQYKPSLYTAVFGFLELLLLRQEDKELFNERWFRIKDNSSGLRKWMEHGGTIEFERGEDGRVIRIPSFQELLRELRNGPWWEELTNYTRNTCPDRVGASYARDWLVKVDGMLK